MRILKMTGATGLLCALLASACADAPSLLPTSPSAVAAPSSNTLTSSVQAPKKVELEGLVEAVAGNVLTVAGQNVVVPASVVVHHGSKVVAFADLAVGDRVHVRAELVSGVLTATDVMLQNPGSSVGGPTGPPQPPSPPTPGSGEGLVSNFSYTACPNVTFNLGSQAVSTNSSTVFTGGLCNWIGNGSYVIVTGLVTSGTLVAATVQIF